MLAALEIWRALGYVMRASPVDGASCQSLRRKGRHGRSKAMAGLHVRIGRGSNWEGRWAVPVGAEEA